jgi:hypothetical protein
MKVLTRTLTSSLSQTITVEKRMIVKAIRPRIVLYNDPAGTFTFSIKQGATVLATKSLTLAEILSGAGLSAGQYHHGFVNWEFDQQVVLNKEVYTIELTTSGYTFSEASYFGWVRDHEDLTNRITDDSNILSDVDNPLTVQIWGYQ